MRFSKCGWLFSGAILLSPLSEREARAAGEFPTPPVGAADAKPPRVFPGAKLGHSVVGVVSIDAKWMQYGSYLLLMVETVQVSLDRLAAEGRLPRRPHGAVQVKFTMDSTGAVSGIVSEPGKSTGPIADACVQAIRDRAPFLPWTDDMKAALGDRQEMTLSFNFD